MTVKMKVGSLVLTAVFLILSVNALTKDKPGHHRSLTNLARQKSIKNTRILKVNAGSPDWSPGNNDYIVYHARGNDGYYDVYMMKADTTEDRCLTCDHQALPNKHIGEPIWHPSGEWIVFKAEKEKHFLPRLGALAVPAIGFHNDIWIMSRDGKKVFQLTDLKTRMNRRDKTPICGVLNPHFSNDGSLLSWSERVGEGGKWGNWVIRVADFEIKNGRPSIRDTRSYTPGSNQQYYESNDFMPDGKHLLICGNLEPGQDERGIDIYILNLITRKTTRLTHSLDQFDECPHVSPGGSRIAYLKVENIKKVGNRGAWWNWAKGEIWLMKADGTNKIQLTRFNRPGSPDSLGKRAMPAKIAWNEKGSRLLLGVAFEEKPGKLRDYLILSELPD